MVVLLDDLALLIAPIEAVFLEELQQRRENLDPAYGEIRPAGIKPGFNGVVSFHKIQPFSDVVGHQPFTVALAAIGGGRVDQAGDPISACLDGGGMNRWALFAALVLGIDVERLAFEIVRASGSEPLIRGHP